LVSKSASIFARELGYQIHGVDNNQRFPSARKATRAGTNNGCNRSCPASSSRSGSGLKVAGRCQQTYGLSMAHCPLLKGHCPVFYAGNIGKWLPVGRGWLEKNKF
jgi:hypothetical protein